ncbi:B3 domain-containing protein At1g05920-like [Argentina anserina]|uniref:B3 domain-containing protein At1g05920-like n=1 Tax=Argentina anserina TaxID=57926 RepID=UPI0021762891|nr:B3 domain-containing protein At1g05920-like [Potentilla anserina]
MGEEDIVITLEAVQELKRKVIPNKKLHLFDELLLVAAVYSNKEDEVIQALRERSKSQESGESTSSAVESLRKLNADRVIRKRWDESNDVHSDLRPELKKKNLDYFDSKDDHDHGDLGDKRDMVIFTSEKDEDAVRTDYIRKNEDDDDDDDDDDDRPLTKRKREEKGKGLMTRYYSPPSSHPQQLSQGYIRKKNSESHKKFFNSNDGDHSDLRNKKKTVSFKGKKQSYSAFESQRNNGIEPRKRSYENDAGDTDWDFDSKESKNKGKALIHHRETKRRKHNSPPNIVHRDLPGSVKRKIETMGGDGDKAQLVFQKELYISDIKKQQNRLSMPINQLLRNFLEPHEVKRLENTAEFMDITIIDPMGEEESLHFKKWKYKETSVSSVKSYVLINRWAHVANKNRLKQGDLIQVWSFRDIRNNLHLAVVKRDENCDGGAAGFGSSSSNAANANASVVRGEGSSNANSSSGEGSSGDHDKEDGITVGVLVEESRSKVSSEKSMEDVD